MRVEIKRDFRDGGWTAYALDDGDDHLASAHVGGNDATPDELIEAACDVFPFADTVNVVAPVDCHPRKILAQVIP